MKKSSLLLVVCLFLASPFITAQTFSLVKDIAPLSSGFQNSFPAGFTLLNNKIYFTAFNGVGGHKLYETDGTAEGTLVVGPSVGAAGSVFYLTQYNGKLIFTYDDGVNGLELWTSDGTSGGTVLLKDVWKGSKSSHPQNFTLTGGKLFFQASDSLRTQGLWVTDGTEAGTVKVKDIYASPSNGSQQFMELNGKIYFVGNTGTGYGLWVSDGTAGGTQLIKSGITLNGSHAVLNDKLYFSAAESNGYELWVLDGTASSAAQLKNIYPDTAGTMSSSPDNFFTFGTDIFFTADDGVHGKEWWATDGTAGNTRLVKDIAVGPNSSQPGLINELNGQAFLFVMNNGIGEMYRTDGSEAGTVLVKSPGFVSYAYRYNSRLYFLQGLEVNATLWSSDGTANGTHQILPPAQSMYLAGMSFIGYNGSIYLHGFIDDMGLELCRLSNLVSGIERKDMGGQLSEFILDQNYPNPFNPSTTLGFTIQASGYTTLKVYDAVGREVATLANEEIEAGVYHQRIFDASGLASGMYFARLVSGGKTQLKSMVLIK